MTARARRHAIAMLAAVAACTLVSIAVYRAELGRPTRQSDWIDSLYVAKEAAMARARPPRVVLGGGSSVLFGLRADLLADEWGVPVINFGTHAGLDLDYLLHRLEPVLVSGDALVLSLEYELYDRDPEAIGPVLLDYLLARDPEYLLSLPLHRQATAAFALTWDRAIEPWRAHSGNEAMQGVYRIGSLGPSGDVIGNERTGETSATQEALRILGPVPLAIRERNLEHVGAFLDRCRRRGIRVVAVAPPLLRHPGYAETRYVEGWQRLERWYAARGVPFLVAPRENLLPLQDFFDTKYHLVRDAAERNSKQIAARLPRPVAREVR